MAHLVRAQNWILRQILIFPLRNAIIIAAIVVAAGYLLVASGQSLRSNFFPILAGLATLNLGVAAARHQARRLRRDRIRRIREGRQSAPRREGPISPPGKGTVGPPDRGKTPR